MILLVRDGYCNLLTRWSGDSSALVSPTAARAGTWDGDSHKLAYESCRFHNYIPTPNSAASCRLIVTARVSRAVQSLLPGHARAVGVDNERPEDPAATRR